MDSYDRELVIEMRDFQTGVLVHRLTLGFC